MKKSEKELFLVDECVLTVCLPVHNGGLYLERAVRSLELYTYPKFRALIFDNASTDDTGKVAGELQKRFPRLDYIRSEEFVPAYENFNRCGRAAETKYIIFLSCDDVVVADVLADCVENLLQNPEAVLAASSACVVDVDTGEFLRNCDEGSQLFTFVPGDMPMGEVLINGFCMLSTAYKRSAWLQFGQFDKDTHLFAELISPLKVIKGNSFIWTRSVGSIFLSRGDSYSKVINQARRGASLVRALNEIGRMNESGLSDEDLERLAVHFVNWWWSLIKEDIKNHRGQIELRTAGKWLKAVGTGSNHSIRVKRFVLFHLPVWILGIMDFLLGLRRVRKKDTGVIPSSVPPPVKRVLSQAGVKFPW